MISINNHINLMELFFTLSRKCEDIRPELISLQYQAPHKKIFLVLNDDDDLSNMLHPHVCMKLTIIDMRVVRIHLGAINILKVRLDYLKKTLVRVVKKIQQSIKFEGMHLLVWICGHKVEELSFC